MKLLHRYFLGSTCLPCHPGKESHLQPSPGQGHENLRPLCAFKTHFLVSVPVFETPVSVRRDRLPNFSSSDQSASLWAPLASPTEYSSSQAVDGDEGLHNTEFPSRVPNTQCPPRSSLLLVYRFKTEIVSSAGS